MKNKLDGYVRRWILRVYPGEKKMIGNFDSTVTWRILAKKMLQYENFYDICNSGESMQREYCFQKLSELFDVGYDFWYYLWLYGQYRDVEKTVKNKILKMIKEK